MSIRDKILISVIIPTYNEEKRIRGCLESLQKQSLINLSETLVVDDSSKDRTVKEVLEFESANSDSNVKLFHQVHSGPGVARNFGAEKAVGAILVFVDADMSFDPKFLENLTKPIFGGKTIGCDIVNGFLANADNFWAKCWNIGRFYSAGVVSNKAFKEMDPVKLKESTIFRAISRDTFVKVGGFDTDGDYTDDESLSRKLGVKTSVVKDAVYFHYNPDSLIETIQRTAWIGNSKKINNSKTRLFNLVRFALPFSFAKGIVIGVKYGYPQFLIFKLIYDFVIFLQLIKAL